MQDTKIFFVFLLLFFLPPGESNMICSAGYESKFINILYKTQTFLFHTYFIKNSNASVKFALIAAYLYVYRCFVCIGNVILIVAS